jgi:hypothetical protein
MDHRAVATLAGELRRAAAPAENAGLRPTRLRDGARPVDVVVRRLGEDELQYLVLWTVFTGLSGWRTSSTACDARPRRRGRLPREPEAAIALAQRLKKAHRQLPSRTCESSRTLVLARSRRGCRLRHRRASVCISGPASCTPSRTRSRFPGSGRSRSRWASWPRPRSPGSFSSLDGGLGMSDVTSIRDPGPTPADARRTRSSR